MAPLLLMAALATTPAARFADDAPVAAPAEEAPKATLAPSDAEQRSIHWAAQFGIGATTALVAVPVSLYLAEAAGQGSNSLIGAGLPALLLFGLLPPLAITFATWLFSEHESPGTYRWWPSLLANIVINGASLAVAASLGLSIGVAGTVMLHTLVQMVLQPAATTVLMRVWTKEKQQAAVITSHDPVAPTTFVANAASWSF